MKFIECFQIPESVVSKRRIHDWFECFKNDTYGNEKVYKELVVVLNEDSSKSRNNLYVDYLIVIGCNVHDSNVILCIW